MPATPEAGPPVLAVADVVTEIGGLPVVDHVSFDVAPGEVVALVGESGSGKSLTALTVMGCCRRRRGSPAAPSVSTAPTSWAWTSGGCAGCAASA